MSKHTAGPWRVDKNSASAVNANEKRVAETNPGCDCCADLRISKEQKANARLIAAAPEMYEELKRLHAEGDCGHETPGVHGCFCDILAKVDGTYV